MTEQSPPQTDRFRNILAFSLIAAFIAIIPLLVFKRLGTENKDIITYMVGQLSGMATTALGFYFVNKAGQDALDNKRADNTGKLADAVVAASNNASGGGDNSVSKAADDVADAAVERAGQIKGTGK